jgi:hypothetical protein
VEKKHKVITEEFVKRSVIKFLTNEGWSKNLDYDDLHVHGVDIKVTNSKYHRTFFIEAKGGSTGRSSAEVAFVYSLGQIVTRMKSLKARYYFGVALPVKSAEIAIRRIPYQFAIAACLQVLSVDEFGKVIWYKPVDIKNLQLNASKERLIARSSRLRC